MKTRQKLEYIDHVLQQILEDNLENKDILIEVARNFITEMHIDIDEETT
jgi:propanediol utilization protein